MLTASRPNLIPRAELGENVKRRRDWRRGGGCSRARRGGGGLVEINLPVDGSPPLGLESTFAPTAPLPLSLSFPAPALSSPLPTADTRVGEGGRPRRLSPLRPLGRKDHLVNSSRLVINSTLVGHERPN